MMRSTADSLAESKDNTRARAVHSVQEITYDAIANEVYIMIGGQKKDLRTVMGEYSNTANQFIAAFLLLNDRPDDLEAIRILMERFGPDVH